MQTTTKVLEPYDLERIKFNDDEGLKANSYHDILPIEKDQPQLTLLAKGSLVSTSTPSQPSETSKDDPPSNHETEQYEKDKKRGG